MHCAVGLGKVLGKVACNVGSREPKVISVTFSLGIVVDQLGVHNCLHR